MGPPHSLFSVTLDKVTRSHGELVVKPRASLMRKGATSAPQYFRRPERGFQGLSIIPCWGEEQYHQRGPLEVQTAFLTVMQQALLWRWISKWEMGPPDNQD